MLEVCWKKFKYEFTKALKLKLTNSLSVNIHHHIKFVIFNSLSLDLVVLDIEKVTYNDKNCIVPVSETGGLVANDPTQCGIKVAFEPECSLTFFYDINSRECSCVKKNHECIRKKHGVQNQYRLHTSIVIHK